MSETVVQIEATPRNTKIDIESLQLKLDKLGIDFLYQREDIYDPDALFRTFRDKRLKEFEGLKGAPKGVKLRRPPTVDERLAYGLKGDATYIAFIDEDGDFASGFEFPEE